MPNKYSDHAIGAIEQAPLISASMGHTYTGTEHLLLALLIREDCVAARILSSKGFDYQKARLAVASHVGLGTSRSAGSLSFITQNFKTVLKKASDATPASVSIITTKTILDQMLLLKSCGAYRIISSQSIKLDCIPKEEFGEKASVGGIDAPKSHSLPQNLYGITNDLTALALSNGIENVVGREKEIEAALLMLSRKQKNSPCLVGAAGVGKTAIVHAVAQRIAHGNCPAHLRDKRILTLDPAALTAGTKYRGDMEERIKNLIGYCEIHKDVILFIDEIHTIVGAGATEGSLDAANMLKPALSSGQVRIIGATTRDEYEKHIEKDPALERRFCKIPVNEPTRDQTILILQGVAPNYEKHHKIRIDNSIIPLCADLALKCMKNRHFPDKAIDLLDLACAIAAGECQEAVYGHHVTKAASCLTSITVNAEGVPAGIFNGKIDCKLKEEIIGQEKAINDICSSIQNATTGINDHNRPLCSLLLLGPKGVGKSQSAKVLANAIFPDSELSEHFYMVDMSKYTDPQSISGLLGAPAGYVGHERGSALIKHVKKHPYSVILLDNVHKAHKDTLEIIARIFDGGIIHGNGEDGDMRSCIIIMTASICDTWSDHPIGFRGTEKEDQSISPKALEELFPSEVITRLDGVVGFEKLSKNSAATICQKQIAQLLEGYGGGVGINTDALVYDVLKKCDIERYGAWQIQSEVKKVLNDRSKKKTNSSNARNKI